MNPRHLRKARRKIIRYVVSDSYLRLCGPEDSDRTYPGRPLVIQPFIEGSVRIVWPQGSIRRDRASWSIAYPSPRRLCPY